MRHEAKKKKKEKCQIQKKGRCRCQSTAITNYFLVFVKMTWPFREFLDGVASEFFPPSFKSKSTTHMKHAELTSVSLAVGSETVKKNVLL